MFDFYQYPGDGGRSSCAVSSATCRISAMSRSPTPPCASLPTRARSTTPPSSKPSPPPPYHGPVGLEIQADRPHRGGFRLDDGIRDCLRGRVYSKAQHFDSVVGYTPPILPSELPVPVETRRTRLPKRVPEQVTAPPVYGIDGRDLALMSQRDLRQNDPIATVRECDTLPRSWIWLQNPRAPKTDKATVNWLGQIQLLAVLLHVFEG